MQSSWVFWEAAQEEEKLGLLSFNSLYESMSSFYTSAPNSVPSLLKHASSSRSSGVQEKVMQILWNSIPVPPEEGEEDYEEQRRKRAAACFHQGDDTIGHCGHKHQKHCHNS